MKEILVCWQVWNRNHRKLTSKGSEKTERGRWLEGRIYTLLPRFLGIPAMAANVGFKAAHSLFLRVHTYVLNKYSYQGHAASTIKYQALPVHAIVKAKSERI